MGNVTGRRGAGGATSEPSGSWLQTATQAAGLLAALTAVVYATGAAVLVLRLAIEDLPWENVVSQLPREFLLSVGVGQVLLPSLVVGAAYGLYRAAVNEGGSTPPQAFRWRDSSKDRTSEGWRVRRQAIRRYLLAFFVLLGPLASVLVARLVLTGEEPDYAPLIVAGVVLPFVAIAVQEVRGLLIKHHRPMRRWNHIRAIARMAAVYIVAAIPAMTVAVAAIPLSEAKVCTTDGYAEGSFLIGETSDRVYLGERQSDPVKSRRIAVFPLTQVEEIFIGRDAEEAECEFETRRRVKAERSDGDS
jgi:hypothetical protein